jgi:YegS/Rv2252/BmrU family lipid kinase
MNATVVFNPNAGRGISNEAVHRVTAILEDAGWAVDTAMTCAPGDATRLARAAVEAGAGAVLAAGGDGTVNEVVQALAGTQTALGYLPFGTVNVWARELGIPLLAEDAARALLEGRIETVDLGRANERYFLLMAGLGFDAEVVRRAEALERYKARTGILPYVAASMSAAVLYRGFDVELRYEDVIQRVEALMLVVGNTRLYGGRYYFTPRAVANDGWLDVCIVKGKGPLRLARQSLPLLVSGSVAYSDVEAIRVRDLIIRSDTPIPYQLDGELTGATPLHIRVAPHALRVIVPSDASTELIAV